MASVDSRIVTMKFDNTQFQQGATQTMSTLEKLKQSLNFSAVGNLATKGLSGISTLLSKFGLKNPFAGATSGLSGFTSVLSKIGLKNPFAPATQGAADLQSATSGFSPQGMIGGVTSISRSWLAMATVATTAISNVTNRAINAGAQMAKSLTISPIKAGFDEYELKMGSIQTILANTAKYGTSLGTVTAKLDELNEYADKTIYNFGDMTKNIGLFTNSGMRIGEATSVIKGFSNAAAASGTSSQGAASAAYQLSQAFSTGTIRLMDWRSLTNVGLGNKNMQQGVIDIADAMGTLNEKGITAKDVQNDFNGSLEKNWLSADVMSNYLKIMAGDMTKAEQAQLGLTDSQIQGFTKQQKTAEEAATKVRTFTGLVGTLRESVGSSWAQTFDTLIGDFNEGTALFTSVNKTLGGAIGKFGDDRNALIEGWDKLGGRKVLIDAVTNAWNAMLAVIKPIHEAFREIFPPATAQGLYNITTGLRDFTKSLIMGDETSKNLKRTFAGVFAVFSIVGQVIGGIVGVFLDLFGVIASGGGSFLNFTGGIGDFLVALDLAIKKGGLLNNFFSGLTAILTVPINILKILGGLIASLFSGFDSGSASGAFSSVTDQLDPIAAAGERIKAVFDGIGAFFTSIAVKIGEAFGGIGAALASSLTPDTFNSALDAINTGLLGAILLMIKNFMSGGLTVDFGGGLFDQARESLGAVTDTMKSMQTQIKADVLIKIATALAILTASILVLSTIDSGKLATALSGMAIGFAGLQIALVSLTHSVGLLGAAKLPLVTGSLLALGAAMLVFSLSLKILASIDLEDLIKGIAGMAAMMYILVKAVEPLSINSPGMLKAGVALIAIAIALRIMANALQAFASMSWEEMGKGLAGVAGSLLILAGAMKVMPTDILMQAAALLILSAALKVIATVVADFGAMSLESLATGFIGLAGSLLIIAGAMRLMPTNMAIQAASLLVLSAALTVIGAAVQSMGGMSIEEIGKGLGTLAGALVILAAGLYLMSGTLAGAAALVIAAGALALLTPVLLALGTMSWEAITKGMVVLAGTFLILGLAGYLLTPLVPVLAALAAVLVVVGVGLVAIAAAAVGFASAFAIVVAAAAVGSAVLSGLLRTIIGSIPIALAAFGRGIVAFASAIANGGPAFVRAMSTIISSMLTAIIRNVPKFGQAFLTILRTILRVIVTSIPSIVNAGLRLIVGFLQAINKNVPKIIPIAVSIITKFINGVAKNIGKVIQAGVNLVIKFINGVSRAIDQNAEAMGRAGARLGVAIVRGMARGIAGGASEVAGAALSAAGNALSAAKRKLGIKSPSKEFMKVGDFAMQGFARGITTRSGLVSGATTDVAQMALIQARNALSNMSELVDSNFDMSPVVSPVLDLTALQSEAIKMGSILSTSPITTDVSYLRAADLSADAIAAQAAAASDDATPADSGPIEFKQYNYSPKALSPREIYLNTRNQLSLAKEALSV